MKKQEWTAGLDHIDPVLLEQYEKQKEALIQKKKKRNFWIRSISFAACFALILGTVLVFSMLNGEGPGVLNHTPVIFDATVSPEKLSGSSLEFIHGSSLAGGGGASDPPEFEFSETNFVAKVKVVNNHPDVYYKLDVSSVHKPQAYRLIQMECIDILHGNVPQYFLYLIPESRYVDMSVYDSLLISMWQLGTENYVLRNATKNQMEAFELPIFADPQDHPELGNVIAFSDGIFDESLWQTESWLYGYQFGRFYLENPDRGDLCVRRGGSEKETIKNIKSSIQEWIEWRGEYYEAPTLVTLEFTSQQAQDAVEYVSPFENGVFSQYLIIYNNTITFRRYINGCQTEETITINLETEEVVYSDVRYTEEDMASLENISVHLSDMAKEYATNPPRPPHTNPKDKTLLCLNLYAWYAKVDGKLYGVIKTAWRYRDDNERYCEYYDDSYVLYDMQSSIARNISRDELVTIVGGRNVYNGEYGTKISVPLE